MPNTPQQQYAVHRWPCLDKYPAGRGFVDNEQIAHRAMMMAQLQHPNLASGKLSAAAVQKTVQSNYDKLKAAFVVDRVWDSHTHPELRVAFMDGTPQQRAFVQKVITDNLQPLMTNINLVWNVPLQESHIRVSFRLKGQAWSVIGNAALQERITEPTMNLGWIDDDTDYDADQYRGTGAVVLHEFGHAIGLIHEHQSPFGNPIKWNKEVVYAELKRTNGWDAAQVDHNMWEAYGDYDKCQAAKTISDPVTRRVEMSNYCSGDLVNGSTYDPHSIMHYWFPASWQLPPVTPLPVNKTYSPMDRQWISRFYSHSAVVPNIVPAVVAPDTTTTSPVTTTTAPGGDDGGVVTTTTTPSPMDPIVVRHMLQIALILVVIAGAAFAFKKMRK